MFAIIHAASYNRSRNALRQSERIGLVAGGLTVCLVCVWLGVVAARPFLLAAKMRANNDAVERQVLSLRLQNQRTEHEIKALQTPEGVMRSARRLGFTLPNEYRLRVPKRPDPALQ